MMMLGYAGWAPGQLEEELSGNAWLTCPVDEHILFDLPRNVACRRPWSSLGWSRAT